MLTRIAFAAIVSCLLFSFSAIAQEKDSFVQRIIDRVLAPSVELDPNAVYQPAPRWTFALTGDIRRARMYQEHNFQIFTAKIGNNDELIVESHPAVVFSNMRGDMTEGVGFQAGFGGISLSLSKKFREKGSDNHTLSFDFMGAGYALQLQFFNFSNPVEYRFVKGEQGDWFYSEQFGKTENPGRMRSLILDAFYAFNRRTFAYSAAYKSSVIQRRSAGSWMIGSKVNLGEFSLDPSEDISLWTGGLASQSSAQASVGAGYSYNFVPYYRQPYGDREEGLRNLTFNVTFIPMVTMFNQFTSTAYESPLEGKAYPYAKTVMNGNLLVNYVARAGAAYTRDLFSVNLSASYDSYVYKGRTSLPLLINNENNMQTSGGFGRWIVSLRLCRRF